MLQEFIAPAVSLGVSAATIPGPLIVYLVNTTLTRGWQKGLLVVLSPLITDLPIIVLMTFILHQMPAEVLKLIQLGGGCLLLFIGWGALKQYRTGDMMNLFKEDNSAAESSWRHVLLTGIMMNFLSPGPWLFWGTVNGPLLVKALESSTGHGLAFLAAFYGTFLCGLCAWVLLFHYARYVRRQYLQYIVIATVLLLLWFGVGLITAAIGLDSYHLWLVVGLVAAWLLRRAWLIHRLAK